MEISMNINLQGSAPLKQQIEQEVDQHRLSSKQLEQLMELQTRSASAQAPKLPEPKEKLTKPLIAIAACLFIALIATTIPFDPSRLSTDGEAEITSNRPHSAVIKAISAEVVKNHLKLKPLDIKTQSIDEARRFFEHLEFSPIYSTQARQRFSLSDGFLLGGRYCSIQGTTAAQLRFETPDKQLNTLYEVSYDELKYGPIPSLKDGESAIELQVKGLSVRLWRERGLMMVLVSP